MGTAGWSLPAKTKEETTHLHRYSRVFPCTEINSTFYRPHRAATWARWAADTPVEFRFSIKAPKTITHESKLRNTESLLEAFLEQIEPIREKAGPILFQLPPSLAFDMALAEDFFAMLRTLYKGEVAFEPRNATWFTCTVNALLQRHSIARVAADPAKGAPQAAEPGGDTNLVYYRLHGSLRIYYSSYGDDFLVGLAARIKPHKNSWTIFDNTALSHASSNALHFQKLMART